jgi:hypothetical protein
MTEVTEPLPVTALGQFLKFKTFKYTQQQQTAPTLPSNLRNMCDTLSTSILLGTLSLLPVNRYIALGFVSVALIIYATYRQRPTCKLGRVEREIQEETLKHAMPNCARDHLDLTDGTC